MELPSGLVGIDGVEVRPYSASQPLVVVCERQPWATFIALGYKAFVDVPCQPEKRPKIKVKTWVAVYAPKGRVSMSHAVKGWERLGLVGRPGRLMFPTGVIVVVAQVSGLDQWRPAWAFEIPEDPIRPEDAVRLSLKNVQSLWHPIQVAKPWKGKWAPDYTFRERVERSLRPPDPVV